MKKAQSDNWWQDEHFQDNLTSLICNDVATLRKVASLLTPEDFRPIEASEAGRPRWFVAECALDHWAKHREPLGRLLRADALERARLLGLGADRTSELREYLTYLKDFVPSAPDALVEKVVRYKGARIKAQALQEMVELQASGTLDDERWREISQRVLSLTNGGAQESRDYLAMLADREKRRRMDAHAPRVPWTFIDPLDDLVKCIGPKQIGLVLAPYKRGKSLMLIWLAVACALQRLNVLFITLEDPIYVVEDRLDSVVTRVPIKSLMDMPNKVNNRFERFKALVKSNFRTYDGTNGGMTVQKIEQVVAEEREKGRSPDAVFIDYDHKITPGRRRKELREESDETYVALQQLASRWNLILWTAAQTQRDTKHLKILSGDRVADDINKIRNAHCAISMGKGESTEDAIYLWIAAHKTDRQEVGCEIIPDLSKQMIYDRDATRRVVASSRDEES